MTATSTKPGSAPAARPGGSGRMARMLRARPEDPRGRGQRCWPCSWPPACCTWSAWPQRLGQRVLRGRRAGRQPELEGVPVRLAGPLQLHLRGQARRLPLAHGADRAHLRRELLEPARPAGPRRHRHGRRALHHRAPLVRAGGRDHRRGGHGADPGRHAHLPLQRSRRVHHADGHPGRVPHSPRHRIGPYPVAGPGRGAARPGVPRQDARGVPGPARAGPGLPVCGPAKLGRRIWQLLVGGAALLLTAGWWVAIVLLTPAADRPFVGSTSNNNILSLTFGYNGLGRLTGNRGGLPGGAGRTPGRGLGGAAGAAARGLGGAAGDAARGLGGAAGDAARGLGGGAGDAARGPGGFGGRGGGGGGGGGGALGSGSGLTRLFGSSGAGRSAG